MVVIRACKKAAEKPELPHPGMESRLLGRVAIYLSDYTSPESVSLNNYFNIACTVHNVEFSL